MRGFVIAARLLSITGFAIAGFAITGFANSASAADLAVKAPMAAPVPFTWTGCYVGGHIGGAVGRDTAIGILGISNSFGSTGFDGGGQIGCDYQFASNWIVGVEGMAAWASLSNTHASTVINPALGATIPSQVTFRNDFLASATARLGYSFADRWLVFGKGGAAWTRDKIDDAFISPVFGFAVDPAATVSRTGWTAGTGVEWAFAPHWSAIVEYDYYGFGNQSIVLTSATTTVSGLNLKDTIQTVIVGVNYRF